ncbi:MAG: hypothetical protein M3R07_00975, partial [Gemmatimonadota bacterium]|nr:hypothetical protein [Gemmatimonadota bacterium]
QYMSPEQATGDRVIDSRTDVYSLGAVTYEMLTGEPPHSGRTAQAVIAKLMTENPRPITTLRPAVPQHVEAAIACALEKLPADRFATAREFADALQGKTATRARPVITSPLANRRSQYVLAAAAAVSVLSLAVAGWAVMSGKSTDAPSRPVRVALALTDDAKARIGGSSLGISPDGSSMAYVGGPNREIFVQRLDELTPRRLSGTEGAARPVFSPDGQSIAFNLAGGIRTVPASGGPVTSVVDSAGTFDWQDGVTIIFEKHVEGQLGLWRVNASGGTHERVTVVTPEADPELLVEHKRPAMLPGGKALVFALVRDANPGELAAVRIGEGKIIELGVRGDNARYLGNGYLAFSRRDGTIAAVAFDPERLRVSGPEVTVVEGVSMTINGNAAYTVAGNGTLLYGPRAAGASLVEVDRSGKATPLLPGPLRYRLPRISPDGRRIALSSIARGQVRLDQDIWIFDRVSQTLTPLTSDRMSGAPAWSSDGRMVAWVREDSVAPGKTQSAIWWQPWNGSLPAKMLAEGASIPVFYPGGGYLLATVWKGVGRRELTRISLSADKTATVLLSQPGHPMARISPDGRWLAYVSSVSGRQEVYARSLTGAAEQYQVSASGGIQPVWSPDGTEIFFGAPGGWLLAAQLRTTPDFTVARRDTLFEVQLGNGIVAADYDVTADGKHFVLSRTTGAGVPILVLGWADEVREKVKRASRK